MTEPVYNVAPVKTDPSELTTDALQREIAVLKELLITKIDHMQEMLQERFESQTKAVDTALESQQNAMKTAFAAAEKAVDRRQDTLDREFHEHLDQVRHENALAFVNNDKAIKSALDAQKEAVTKAEIANEKRFDSVNEFRGQLSDQAANFFPRREADVRFKSLEKELDDLRGTRREGVSSTVGVLFGIAGLVVVIIAVILANLLTTA